MSIREESYLSVRKQQQPRSFLFSRHSHESKERYPPLLMPSWQDNAFFIVSHIPEIRDGDLRESRKRGI